LRALALQLNSTHSAFLSLVAEHHGNVHALRQSSFQWKRRFERSSLLFHRQDVGVDDVDTRTAFFPNNSKLLFCVCGPRKQPAAPVSANAAGTSNHAQSETKRKHCLWQGKNCDIVSATGWSGTYCSLAPDAEECSPQFAASLPNTRAYTTT
jgi:hypothetical protein